MQLVCRRCGQVIEPQDEMVVVTIGRPDRWVEIERAATRLNFAPGRWHYRCVPKPVRKYVGAISV
jgi:hypothetical protein